MTPLGSSHLSKKFKPKSLSPITLKGPQSCGDYSYRKLLCNFVSGPTLIDAALGDQIRVGARVHPPLCFGPIERGFDALCLC